jgi:protein-S-isoprenylcysteine O-methyltransferase Ste14
VAACGRRGGAIRVGLPDAVGRRDDVTPDKPVSKLIQEEPFRYSRNPIYVSDAMIYAGIAVLRNSLWAIVLLPLAMFAIQREVMGREERYLERIFGEEYLEYKARVRRWV